MRAAYDAVEAAYAKAGHAPTWPVSLVVEPMPIMGATQSRAGRGHLIHVSLQAAESAMASGLIAHEMGHIVRTEAGHPSHDRTVHDRALARVTVPRAFARGFPRVARSAIGHVEDIYADDYAIPLMVGGRSREFFGEWARNATRTAGDRWDEVFGALDIAFSIGNLDRHRLLEGDDPLRGLASDFAAGHGIRSLGELTTIYRDLPDPTSSEACEDLLAGLVRTVLGELRARPA